MPPASESRRFGGLTAITKPTAKAMAGVALSTARIQAGVRGRASVPAPRARHWMTARTSRKAPTDQLDDRQQAVCRARDAHRHDGGQEGKGGDGADDAEDSSRSRNPTLAAFALGESRRRMTAAIATGLIAMPRAATIT